MVWSKVFSIVPGSVHLRPDRTGRGRNIWKGLAGADHFKKLNMNFTVLTVGEQAS
jgi:hypothetical protein